MNSRLIIPLGFVALALAVGCKKTPAATAETGVELRFSVDIAGATTKASKAAFSTGDTIGLWMVPYVTTDAADAAKDKRGTLRGTGNYFDNMRYKMGATGFTSAASIYYPSPLVKVDLYAVAPYDAKMSAKTDNSMADPTKYGWRVKANQTVADSVVMSDLMTTLSLGAKSGMAPAPTLLFRHRLAKVNVNVTVPETFQGHNVLALKSVEILNTKLRATVNITDTTTSVVAVKPVLETTNNDAKDISALKLTSPAGSVVKGAYIWEAIVIPQQVAAGSAVLRITLTLKDLGDIPLLAYTTLAQDYLQMKQATYNVTIEDKGVLALGTPTIQQWGSTESVTVDGRRAARMIFPTTNGEVVLTALGVETAKLTIDDTTYMSDVVRVKDSLFCTYMEPKHRKGDKFKAVAFFKKGGVQVTVTKYNPVIPTGAKPGLNIAGDPTAYDYKKGITTVTF